MGELKRNSSIDAIKGMAIVLVMIGHVFVHNQMEDPYVYDFIKAVQMPLFMIISGYLCGQGRKISGAAVYGKVMKKRAIAYLVPFFSWLTIMHLRDLPNAYKTILFQLDFGLWFLAILLILTFMVYTAQLAGAILCKKHPFLSEVVFWGVYGGFCSVLLLQIITGNTLLSPYLTIIYVPFYMLGYVAGAYGKRFFCWNEKVQGKISCRNNPIIRVVMLLFGLLFLYLVAVKDLNSMESKLDTLTQMLASLVGSMAIIYGVFGWKDGRSKKFFAKIGKYTLEIYVIHYHFANILNIQNRKYNFYTWNGAVFVAASFVVMCAITFVSIWLLKKVKIFDFLFFGKVHHSDKKIPRY